VIALITVIAVLALVPSVPTVGGGSVRGELSALRRPQVWLNLGVIAVGFGGTFAVYSYVTPILTDRAGAPEAAVPLVLAVFGVGMTLGNLVGGRLAERAPLRTIAGGMVAIFLVLVAFTVTSASPIPAAITLFLLGFSVIAVTPALTTRLIDAAAEGPSLAAASYHSAFNVANALGAAIGGLVLAAGLGYAAPAAVGAVLPLLGLVVLGVSVWLERRTARVAAAG
jgi:MFS transporter, DHA1 family, inner membrane transport protein